MGVERRSTKLSRTAVVKRKFPKSIRAPTMRRMTGQNRRSILVPPMESPAATSAGTAGNVFALDNAVAAAAGAFVGGLEHGDRAASFACGALFVGACEANAGCPAAGTFLRGVMPVRVNHCGLSRGTSSSTVFRSGSALKITPLAFIASSTNAFTSSPISIEPSSSDFS